MIMSAVGVECPLGLGLGRAVPLDPAAPLVAVHSDSTADEVATGLREARGRQDGGTVVVAGLHMASPAVVAVVERLLSTGDGGGVVLAAAGPLPVRLRAYLADVRRAEPDVAAIPDPTVASFGGGWPEAVHVGPDGVPVPSSALRRFMDETREALAEEYRMAVLVAAAEDGLSPEEVAACLAEDGFRVLDGLATLERLGVLAWAGGRAHTAFPAVGHALLETEAQRVWAMGCILRNAPRGAGVVAAATAHLDDAMLIGSSSNVLEALAAAEHARDADAWEALAGRLSAATPADLRTAGLVSAGRLALYRGRLADADAALERLRREPAGAVPPAELDKLGAACRLVGLRGLAVVAEAGQPDPQLHVLASGGDGPAGAEALGDVFAAATGDASAEVGSILHAARRTPGEPALLRAFALCLLEDVAAARAVDLRRDPYGSALAPLVETSCLVLEGRFLQAEGDFDALVGGRWDDLSPLHAALRLWIATGSGAEATRRALGLVAPWPALQTGGLGIAALRARAAATTGRDGEARSGWLEVWDRLSGLGLFGVLAIFAHDVLDVLAFRPEIAVVADAEAPGPLGPYGVLARRMRDGDARGIVAGIEDRPSSPYRLARTLRLLGRLCVETDDLDSARRHLERAEAVFDMLGAPVDAAACRVAVRRFDPRYRWEPGAAQGGRDGLSAREREVLALVVEGLTNKEIAAQLHVAPATVKTHVGSLLRTFGVSSRDELGRAGAAHV